MNQHTQKKWPDFRFNLEETAGAIGDYGTLIPIVLGVSLVTDLNLSHILLFFSIWYIITGLYYKKPVPVEPMKAIGAIVIAGSFTQGEIAASGIILGILFLGLGFIGGMNYIKDKVPNSVIRGIQLGLALMLLETSFGFVVEDYTLAMIGIGIVIGFYIVNLKWKIPDISSLALFGIGIVIGLVRLGFPPIKLLPSPMFVIPSINDFIQGGYLLAIPQAPLTVTNAILATSLLMSDLFIDDATPDDYSKTIGLMNLTSVPFGGFPMCHGSGGLAAQYRFGARTGGSNIISGVILLVIALLFSGPDFVALFPVAIFGSMLVFVALEIGKHGLKTKSYIITMVTAVIAFLTNMTIAFLIGMCLYFLIKNLPDRFKKF